MSDARTPTPLVGSGARRRMAAKAGFRSSCSGEGAEATVLQDYSARELEVRPGEEVIVEEARHDWLLVRNGEGKRGWIPAWNTEPL